MPRARKPIPEGFHTVTPYLVVNGAARAIDFYQKAFGARETYRSTCDSSGRVLNAQLRIGDSMIMLNDEFPEHGCVGPASEGGGSPVTIHLYVEDVDAVFQRAVHAGGTPVMPVADTFWGDRYGQLMDPYGHSWSIATRVEDLAPDQVRERMKEAMGGGLLGPV